MICRERPFEVPFGAELMAQGGVKVDSISIRENVTLLVAGDESLLYTLYFTHPPCSSIFPFCLEVVFFISVTPWRCLLSSTSSFTS